MPNVSRAGFGPETAPTVAAHFLTGYVPRIYRYPYEGDPPILQQDQVFQGTEAPHPVIAGCGCLGEVSGGEKWVWTVSTLWVPDWVVPVPDWPGLRMFRRESSVSKGWNPVRVPPRAQCFRRSVGF